MQVARAVGIRRRVPERREVISVYKRRNPTRSERRRAGKRASQRAEKGVVKSLVIVLGLFTVMSLAVLVLLYMLG